MTTKERSGLAPSSPLSPETDLHMGATASSAGRESERELEDWGRAVWGYWNKDRQWEREGEREGARTTREGE